jgi:predicted transcriptional regulator of viral defense system
MAKTERDRLLNLVRRRGVITTRETDGAGIHSQQLTRLVADGVLDRVARGHYQLTDRPVTEHHGLAVVARTVPRGVICLLSALTVHGISTQLPAEVWVAIEGRSRQPVLVHPPLRVMRFSGRAFTEGVGIHRLEGQAVRVYGVAKTLADLFKYRNKVGLDVALEALREAWRTRKFKMEDLDRAARICRVERVMRPYVEAVVS